MELSKLIEKYSHDTAQSVNFYYSLETPIGTLVGIADDKYLNMLCFEDSKNLEKMIKSVSQELNCKFTNKHNEVIKQLEGELSSYFDGSLKTFTVPIKMIGSDFQKEVWNKMLEMPYGSTQTYAGLAKSLARSASHARAIGAACGANEHILLIPCHRVVATGSKGGFSCGLHRKEWLLKHESKYSLK